MQILWVCRVCCWVLLFCANTGTICSLPKLVFWLQGNVDPMVLFGNEAAITAAVNKCLLQGGPKHHILNVGHGVVQGTPEENVGLFVKLARESGELFKSQAAAEKELAVV
jgi:hypothetical protein